MKSIVKKFGGTYLVRSENIGALSETRNPDRVIVIEFASKKRIEEWLCCAKYKAIESLRLASVSSSALIVENGPA